VFAGFVISLADFEFSPLSFVNLPLGFEILFNSFDFWLHSLEISPHCFVI